MSGASDTSEKPVVVGPLSGIAVQATEAGTELPTAPRYSNRVIALPLSHGTVQVSVTLSACVAVATRLPGASGAVAARLLVTVVSASDAASLFAASLIGLFAGFV